MARLASLLFILLAATQSPPADRKLPVDQVKLPAGFSIEVLADNVPNARQMAVGDKGTIFVGSRTAGRVHALVDRNADMKVDEVLTIAEPVRRLPTSAADCRDGALCVQKSSASADPISTPSNRNLPAPATVVVTDNLPKEGHHGWRSSKVSA